MYWENTGEWATRISPKEITADNIPAGPNGEEILFNDKAEEITWFDQRNFAINTPEFKTIMGTW